MPTYPPDLSRKEIDQLFGGPDGFPCDPGGKFELALVLGGTVSAGAYTAGAVDFLIQAMDCWAAAEGQDLSNGRKVPPVTMALKLITGTSGGGVNAAVAARALAYKYLQAPGSTPLPAVRSGNPFYDLWVSDLTLDAMLGVRDIAAGSVSSLLDGHAIDDAAERIINFSTDKPTSRSAYIGEALRLILTLTNLRGVEYEVTFDDPQTPRHAGQPLPRESYVDHADYIRLAVAFAGRGGFDPRPDELVVTHEGASAPARTCPIGWRDFAEFAKATAAFPLGFPPRDLRRPSDHYRYRVILDPGTPGSCPPHPPRVLQMKPNWQAFEQNGAFPDSCSFLTVDGGATDNEPIELARTALAGVAGYNPRDRRTAQRAVLLIDPFAGANALGPSSLEAASAAVGGANGALARFGLANLGPLTGVAEALLEGMIQQTRYDTSDLVLAADEKVFSRFMLTARRDDKTGAAAIASSGLGAFLGFACRDFMHHDFMLGRRNCQKFLRCNFTLDKDNHVFDRWKENDPSWVKWLPPTDQTSLPIIPLVGAADDEVPQPTWPRGKLDEARLERLQALIEQRFSKLVRFEATALISKIVACLAACRGKSIANAAIDAIKRALAEARLE